MFYLLRYESTVVGQFFGHRHEDEFEVFYDREDPSRAIQWADISNSHDHLMMSFLLTA